MTGQVAASASVSALSGFVCLRCRAEYAHAHFPRGCPGCQPVRPSSLVARYDHRAAAGRPRSSAEPGIWRHGTLLPVRSPQARVSLGEGSTPLLGPYPRADGGRLWIKNESLSPTWSYKDRLAAVGVSAAKEAGATTVAVSSSGNHGAAVAAYAAAAGLAVVVFVPADAEPATLTLIQALGARVVRSSPAGRRELLAHGVESYGWYPLSSLVSPHVGNAYAVEGYKSIAYELVSQLPAGPGAVAVPTCYGEGVAGIAAGFADLLGLGRLSRMPMLIAAEAAGGAPLHRARLAGATEVGEVPPYPTIARSIAGISSSQRALTVLADHAGRTVPVPDHELLAAQRWLGAAAGVFGEASGAAGLAALRTWPGGGDPPRARPAGGDPLPEDAVAIMTGGGLRTVDAIAGGLPAVPSVEPGTAGLDDLVAGWDGSVAGWHESRETDR